MHLAADLISPDFFNQDLPAGLSQVLFGCETQGPIIFDGRAAVEKLWETARACAKANSAYGSEPPRSSSNLVPSLPVSDGSLSSQLESLHRHLMHESEHPPLQFEHEYLGRVQDELSRLDSSLEPHGQPFDWENTFAYDLHRKVETLSTVGLENWLVEETGANGILRDIQLRGPEAEHIAQSFCWK
jgi:hypothetical protein